MKLDEYAVKNNKKHIIEEWQEWINGPMSDWTQGSNKKIWWRCSQKHFYLCKIGNKTYLDRGCPYCAGQKVNYQTCLAAKYPDLAKEWHPTKNGADTIYNTGRCNRSFWWQCLKHKSHIWKTDTGHRIVYNTGCPYCSGKKVCPVTTSIVATHPEKIKYWDFEKNKIRPDQVSSGSDKIVWWTCDHRHSYKQKVYDYLQTDSCSVCVNTFISEDNCLATTHPAIAAQWHPTKNGDLTPHDVHIGHTKHVYFQCDMAEDHVWKVPLYLRKTSGCPYCSNFRVAKSNCIATTHPDVAKRWGSKNKKKSTDFTIASRKEAWFVCNGCSKEYKTIINYMKNNKLGLCTECWANKSEEECRKIFQKLFQKEFIKVRPDFLKKSNGFKLELDGYNEELKIAFEYNGMQHYTPIDYFGGVKSYERLIKNDKLKNMLCKKNGVTLITIPYFILNKKKHFILQELKRLGVKESLYA